jgi:hypothetical protein
MSDTAARLTFALLISLVLCAMTGIPSQSARAATIVYVDIGAAGTNTGTSWANAYTDLQSALNPGIANSEVWVASGVYSPGATTGSSFPLRDDIGIYAGFAGTETARAQRAINGNPTVLTGVGISYHVVTAVDVASTAVLDGFTVTGGMANGASSDDRVGGGIFLDKSNPRLANLMVTGNRAGQGGAFRSEGGSPSFANVTVAFNVATNGAGGSIVEGSPTFTNVTFVGNRATTVGGGLSNNLASLTFTDVAFIGNHASFGGAFEGGGEVSFNRVLFARNRAGTAVAQCTVPRRASLM